MSFRASRHPGGSGMHNRQLITSSGRHSSRCSAPVGTTTMARRKLLHRGVEHRTCHDRHHGHGHGDGDHAGLYDGRFGGRRRHVRAGDGAVRTGGLPERRATAALPAAAPESIVDAVNMVAEPLIATEAISSSRSASSRRTTSKRPSPRSTPSRRRPARSLTPRTPPCQRAPPARSITTPTASTCTPPTTASRSARSLLDVRRSCSSTTAPKPTNCSS